MAGLDLEPVSAARFCSGGTGKKALLPLCRALGVLPNRSRRLQYIHPAWRWLSLWKSTWASLLALLAPGISAGHLEDVPVNSVTPIILHGWELKSPLLHPSGC